MSSKKIIDDSFSNITNDIQRVQTKPTMYISYTGNRAFLHLTHELVNNVLDEYKNANNVSDDTFSIIYDRMDNMFYVEDNGRGIPFENLESACTILHSGTKMHREHGDSAGENGVGLTATNALSEVFEITSYRDGQMRMLQFKNGIKTIDTTTSVRDVNKHGLLVGFKPSSVYLGKSTLDVEDFELWLTKLIFMQKPSIKINFTYRPSGREQTVVKVYQNKTGIDGFLDKLAPEADYLKTPIVLSGHTNIMENDIPIISENNEVNLIDMERDIDLKVVINFKPDSQETIKYSFCNDIENIEHGEHSNSVLNAIITFFKKKVKEDSKKEEIEITNNDILFGLAFMVSMNTNYSTGLFTSQTKHKMDNRDFYEPIRRVTLNALEEYFKLSENKKTLSRVIAFIKNNVRIRLAATKARKSAKKQKSFLETSIIAGYYPPNRIDNPGPNGCELYVVEGDSAGSNARIGRVDPNVQGVLGLGGKPSNAFKISDSANIEKVAPDIAMFFNDILGCGMGKNFNIADCRYKRIIIASDSDVDGAHICGLVVANIYKYARPLLEQGYVYRVITPLYALRAPKETAKVNKDLYLYNKESFFDVYQKKVSKIYKLKVKKDSDFINPIVMRNFLQVNNDYYEMIKTVANQNTTHPDIIEFLAIHLNDFKTTISQYFEELKYYRSDNSIRGSYDGSFHSFIIDDDMMKSLKKLHEIIYINNEGIHHYYMYKDSNELGYISIYNIMDKCKQQEPAIESRFKGQGELSPKEFNLLAMNPNNRSLLRITIEDAQTTAEVMDNLFSDNKQDARKQLVANADISVDDIDN